MKKTWYKIKLEFQKNPLTILTGWLFLGCTFIHHRHPQVLEIVEGRSVGRSHCLYLLGSSLRDICSGCDHQSYHWYCYPTWSWGIRQCEYTIHCYQIDEFFLIFIFLSNISNISLFALSLSLWILTVIFHDAHWFSCNLHKNKNSVLSLLLTFILCIFPQIIGLTYLSVASAIGFILLAGAKYWLYKKLSDDSLMLDGKLFSSFSTPFASLSLSLLFSGEHSHFFTLFLSPFFWFGIIAAINTLFSGIFAIAIGITAQVMFNYSHLWYLDATESMIFAAFLGIYGVKVIAENVLHQRGSKFKDLDSEESSGSEESSEVFVHEKKKLLQIASDKSYTTFSNNRVDA